MNDFDDEPESHTERVGRRTKSSIDFKKFGTRLNNWLNDHGMTAERLATHVEWRDKEHHAHKRIIESLAQGNPTEPEHVEDIAKYCELEIPQRDPSQVQEKRSPFGRGRQKGSGGAQRG